MVTESKSGPILARRMLTFFYNHVFLPEYLSAVAIALLVNTHNIVIPLVIHWPQVRAGNLLAVGPWYWTAMVLFLMLSALLIRQTFRYRRLYSKIKVTLDGSGKFWFQFPEGEVCINDMQQAEETLGRFFERPSRFLTMIDPTGQRWQFNDGLYGYDFLKDLVTEGGLLKVPSQELPERLERVRQRWVRRHNHFAVDPLNGRFTPHTSRLFFLIPVLMADGICSAVGQVAMTQQGLVWAVPLLAPLGLMVSATVSRLVYYRMLTNVFLNSTGVS